MSYIYLAYDHNCGFCRLWKNFVIGIDAGRRLRPIAIKDTARLGLLDSIPASDHYKSFHLVTDNGLVISAGKAIPVLIGLLLNTKALGNLIARSRRMMSVIERTYDILATTTHRLNCGKACPAEFVY